MLHITQSTSGTCADTGPSKRWKNLAMATILALVVPGWILTPTATIAAEAAGANAQAPLSQDKLDSLLAPIALYPDQLLTQILMASTYPLDIVEAARFVKANKSLKGDALDKAVADKKWDPSVQSLTAFPQVLDMMSDKLEWTQQLGDAFLTDEKRVMKTVQGLRQKADAAGNLKSNEQIKVVKEQATIIIIEPAQSTVVYVPSYNPTVVYGVWWAPSYPPYYYPPPPYYYPTGSVAAAGLIGFGLGVAVANNNHWGWSSANWNSGSVNVNINNSNNNTFINNNAEYKNKVNNGNWNHNPAQRKGVAYSNPQTRDQYRKSDPGATASRRDARGFASASGRDGGSGSSGSAGTRDAPRPSAGTQDVHGGRGGDFNRSSGASPSFNSGQSREQAQSFSNRGASSRASTGDGGGRASASGGGSGSRGGGGRGR